MYTRQDYLANKCTHQQYYGQFVGQPEREAVKVKFGSRLFTSTDSSFNDIGLSAWDALAQFSPRRSIWRQGLQAAGDWLSLAGMVCILKEAARQVKEAKPA